jgi:hypothetical protein
VLVLSPLNESSRQLAVGASIKLTMALGVASVTRFTNRIKARWRIERRHPTTRDGFRVVPVLWGKPNLADLQLAFEVGQTYSAIWLFDSAPALLGWIRRRAD